MREKFTDFNGHGAHGITEKYRHGTGGQGRGFSEGVVSEGIFGDIARAYAVASFTLGGVKVIIGNLNQLVERERIFREGGGYAKAGGDAEGVIVGVHAFVFDGLTHTFGQADGRGEGRAGENDDE